MAARRGVDRRLEASSLVAVGEEGGESRPLRLVGTSLYLDRYWREERQVAADLQALGAAPPDDVDDDVLAEGLARLFPNEDDERQRKASASAVQHRFAVVAGGPGTGKTTTVARIVALLAEQAAAAGNAEPLVALAAPTGQGRGPPGGGGARGGGRRSTSSDAVRAQLLAAQASTLHRLLGWRPDSHSRFRHHRGNRLPHDVVIVDETSMVSLSLMARLVEAVRPQARLVLVGDPGQLTSIEAGAVLGDIVGTRGATRPGIVVLDRVHRFGGAIATLAEAIRRGDADATIDALSGAPDEVRGSPVDPDAPGALAPVHDGAVAAARAVIDAARDGDAPTRARGPRRSFRVLCAHRRGPYGVETWTDRIERWLADEVEGFGAEGQWYVGPPAARDRERLRPAPLQRRHRRRRRHRAGARERRVRAPRRGHRVQPLAAGRGRQRLRDDRPQEPGLAVRRRRRPAARPDVAASSRASCSTRRSPARASA